MCGRYAIAYDVAEMRAQLAERGLRVDNAPANDAVHHCYNVAPNTMNPIYRAAAHSDGKVSYSLEVMKWGLVPSWQSTAEKGFAGTLKTINCRDDSLLEDGRGIWNSVKHTQRCVVVAQGFFEWLKRGNEKLPHYVHPKDDSLFLFAGLYSISKDSVATYTIITTSSSPQLRFLHERMPVVLQDADAVGRWLDPGRKRWGNELQGLLRSCEEGLEVYRVAKEVGKVGGNEKRFVEKLEERKGGIEGFFGRKREGEVKEEEGVKRMEREEVEIKLEDDDMSREQVKVKVEEYDTNDIVDLGLKVKLDEDDTKDRIHMGNTSNAVPSPSAAQRIRSSTRNLPPLRKKKVKPSDGNQKITGFFKK